MAEAAVAALLLLGAPSALLLPAAPAAAQFTDGFNFLRAVRDRDVLKARSFLDKPGSVVVNSRDADSGDTALHIVVRHRDTPWMGFLLQNGADPNIRDRAGETPLMLAARTGFADGVRVMLAVKADVDAPNSRGETPLMIAVFNRDANVARLLLEAGANADRPDNATGLTAREHAARDPRAGAVGRLLAEAERRESRAVAGPQL
ncbi:MAG: ankyrin repeat domain-containing protein [Thermaurantiacus sp.]